MILEFLFIIIVIVIVICISQQAHANHPLDKFENASN